MSVVNRPLNSGHGVQGREPALPVGRRREQARVAFTGLIPEAESRPSSPSAAGPGAGGAQVSRDS